MSIDVSSVRFGPLEAAPVSAGGRVHTLLNDVNDDGVLDLVLFFKTQKTGIKAGDAQACLIGETTAPQAFQGCDSIVTVPPALHPTEGRAEWR